MPALAVSTGRRCALPDEERLFRGNHPTAEGRKVVAENVWQVVGPLVASAVRVGCSATQDAPEMRYRSCAGLQGGLSLIPFQRVVQLKLSVNK